MWYRITLSYACAGIEFDDENERCTQAAPIFNWMIGKHRKYCEQWVHRKGGTFEELSGGVAKFW